MKRLALYCGLLTFLLLSVVLPNAHSADFAYNYAFLWSEETGLINLGTLGGSGYSYATAINNNGEVVGFSNNRAFYWSEQTGIQELPTLGGNGQTEARGINDLGQIVGLSSAPDGTHAVMWTNTHAIVDLGLWPTNYFRPYDINNSGTIVGGDDYAINNLGQIAGHRTGVPTLWSPGIGLIELGSLWDDRSGGVAAGINDLGQAVGYSGSPTNGDLWKAFLWNPGTGMQDLGTFGGPQIVALGINNSTQIVGLGDNASNTERRAFLWTEENGLQDLFGIPSMASAINDGGFVVGGIGMPMKIDIKPGDVNTINLHSKTISVAIISDAGFDAPSEVDQSSLKFGVTGDELSLVSCARKAKDVNRDGFKDLVCDFSTTLAGFQCGDSEGILWLETVPINNGGSGFYIRQTVQIIPCK